MTYSRDLMALLAAAKVRDDGRMYLPAADYIWTAPLLCDRSGLHIYGDGIGRTRILCDGLTINGVTSLLTLNADRITLCDLSIVITNTTGDGQLLAVNCDWNCTRPTIKRIEVVGGYGTNPAGGAGFSFYRQPATDRARQYATVEDCIARDAPTGAGFIINSNMNVFTRCEARNVGTLVGQHGYYIQGGYNHFRDCSAYGVAGYSFKATCNIANQDGSAQVFDGCISVDPKTLHMEIDGWTYVADGSNPDVPAGTPLGRGAMVTNCTFRRSKGGPISNGVFVGKNTIIQGCYFEDTVGGDLAQWLVLRDGSMAMGNIFVGTNHPAGVTGLQQGIVTYSDCSVIGNRMQGGQMMLGMKIGPRTLVSGNSINFPATNTNSAITIYGDHATIRDNRITLGGGVMFGTIGTPVGTVFENNY